MIITLDEIAAENGNTKNQDEWVAYWNSIDDGRVMAPMPVFYEIGKTGNDNLLGSLRKDFEREWIVAGTRHQYNPNDLEGGIIHYFGINRIKPVQFNLLIPDYSSGVILDTVLDTSEGLAYIQALFNTKDSLQEIKDTLKRLSNFNSNNTRVWTPNQVSRRNSPNRASGLIYSSGVFRVNGSYDLNYLGRSRGVLINPAGVALEKKAHNLSNGKLSLPYELNLGIHKKASCVYFSNMQEIEDLARYSALFCFKGKRFVLSLTMPTKQDSSSLDERTTSLMAEDISIKEKLNKLYQEFSPLYAHILKYEQRDNGIVLADDIEFFGRPRIKEAKK